MGTRLMLSVPPASIAWAEPPRMRSAANATACRPDAQNRFTVTAEASTGIPALRLAMRATLSPCSASGIAQPMMTSSTSDAEAPGARFKASRNTSAASSSGRTSWSAPEGALPTGVLTAETIRASAIEILQQIFDRVTHLRGPAVEHVVGRVDDHELLRLRELAVELAYLFEWNQLVHFAVNQKRRPAGSDDRRKIAAADGRCDAKQRRHARVGCPGRHRYPR